MAKIIPIRDLKDTSKISELCHSTKEPVYITKNGYSDSVIMSNEAYETQLKRMDAYYKGLKESFKSDALRDALSDVSPEETLERLLAADSDEERLFYEMLGNFLIQLKQREIVEAGTFY